MIALLVAGGGAVGAVLRFVIDRRVQRAHGTAFPWGTLTVNVLGSGLLGLLTGWGLSGGAPEQVRLLLGVGLCGALTTFSTFSHDTVVLFTEERARGHALAYGALTVFAGFGAAAAGLVLADTVFS